MMHKLTNIIKNELHEHLSLMVNPVLVALRMSLYKMVEQGCQNYCLSRAAEGKNNQFVQKFCLMYILL